MRHGVNLMMNVSTPSVLVKFFILMTNTFMNWRGSCRQTVQKSQRFY